MARWLVDEQKASLVTVRPNTGPRPCSREEALQRMRSRHARPPSPRQIHPRVERPQLDDLRPTLFQLALRRHRMEQRAA